VELEFIDESEVLPEHGVLGRNLATFAAVQCQWAGQLARCKSVTPDSPTWEATVAWISLDLG